MAIPPPRRLAPVLLLAALLALQATSAWRMSVTYDEPGHLRYGAQLLRGETARFDDSKMPVSALNALPSRLAGLAPSGPLRQGLSSWLAARAPTMLAGVGLALLVFGWTRRLYGERAALLALLLTVFDPNLLAHGRLVTTDLWAALAFTLVLWTFWAFCREPRSARRGLAAAFALGGAFAVKYSAVLLPPILLLLALARFGPELGARWRQQGGRAAVARALGRTAAWAAAFALVALLVVNAAFLFQRSGTPFGEYRFRSATLREAQVRWPALGALPVPVPYAWLEGLDWVHHRERTGEGWGPVYLRGERRESGGFRGYYLWAWAYKVPLATQLAVAAALVVAWRRRRRHPWRRDEAFLLLPPLLFALHLNLLFAAQMGVRYSLMLFPPLYVFCGSLLAGPPLGRDLGRELGRDPGREAPRSARARRVAAWSLGLGAAWLVVSVLSWHPHYLSYFNELLPDRKRAWRLLADSNLDWGQSEAYVADWLAAHPQAVRDPPEPRAGLVLVRANFLTGVLAGERFAWLRGLDPVGHVGYSNLVFEVRPEDLPRPEAATAQ
jgi:4-amino-4-deoxy-L-arabinose transferase-like glycosyltransferase